MVIGWLISVIFNNCSFHICGSRQWSVTLKVWDICHLAETLIGITPRILVGGCKARLIHVQGSVPRTPKERGRGVACQLQRWRCSSLRRATLPPALPTHPHGGGWLHLTPTVPVHETLEQRRRTRGSRSMVRGKSPLLSEPSASRLCNEGSGLASGKRHYTSE